MLTAVLFDLGDTLIDFGRFDKDAVFREATRGTYDRLASRGHALPTLEVYGRWHIRAVRRAYLWARLRRREFNSLDVLTRIARRIGLPTDPASMIDLAWDWYAPIHKLGAVAPDVAPTLRRLRDAGVKIGLVSNTFIAGAVHDRHLAEAGLLDLLPVRVYSSEIGYPKPHPRIFRTALGQLAAAPAETLFVGDLVKIDMAGARRVGMKTALKQPTFGAKAGSGANGRAGAKPGPLVDYVIQTIGDVLPIVLPAAGASLATATSRVV